GDGRRRQRRHSGRRPIAQHVATRRANDHLFLPDAALADRLLSYAVLVAPDFSMPSISAPVKPASFRISTLCSPSLGCRRVTSGLVLLKRGGMSGMRSLPSVGWSTSFQKPVACSCGSTNRSSSVLTGPCGTLEFLSSAIHSALVRVAQISARVA